jgi:uncharacterized protein (DUF488 family)
MKKKLIYTIGHSTHPIDKFISMLQSFQIEKLIDVRTIPRSRFNPQFNKDTLAKSLLKEGIEYEQRPGLGGLRKPKKDSINDGWRNDSFRGYADYMQTDEFTAQLNDLIKEAKRKRVVIMCAESVPWRCHRSLIADSLIMKKFEVRDIMGENKDVVHKLNPMAKERDGHIYYPSDELTFKFDEKN